VTIAHSQPIRDPARDACDLGVRHSHRPQAASAAAERTAEVPGRRSLRPLKPKAPDRVLSENPQVDDSVAHVSPAIPATGVLVTTYKVGMILEARWSLC